MKKTVSKLLKCAVAFALAFCIATLSSAEIISEGIEGQEYIGEIMLFNASTEDQARKKAEAAGYISVPGNLNTGTGYNAVVMGYKTTTDRSQAITDVSMAQMKNGYRMVSYGDVAEKQTEKLAGVADELFDAVKEFAENYAAGSPAAKETLGILNFYRIDEMNNLLLGDYFVSGKCTREFLLKILSRANSAVINSVYSALTAGTADFSGDNWAQRISECDIVQQLESEESDRELDTEYREYAVELYPALQQFTEKYENAYARTASSKDGNVPVTGTGDAEAVPEETLEDIRNGNELEENDGDALFIAAYEILNTYKYDENTMLGDWIVEAGRKTFSEKDELRSIYPLVASLTNGQAAVMRMTGIAPLVFYLNNTEELLTTSKEYFDKIKSKIRDCGESKALSVWVGTDQTIYDKKVAVTDELERYSQAGARYSDLTKVDVVDEVLSEAMTLLSFVSTVVSIAYSVTVLSASFVGWMANFAVWAGTATTWTVCVSAIGSGVLGSILGVLGCIAVIASYVVFAAMIIILVVLFIKWIVDLCSDEDEEYTEIPATVYDLNGSTCVKYDLIKCSGGSPDLNAGNGKRWNALYFSHDDSCGQPITPDELDNAFKVRVGESIAPGGYTPVRNFGETAPANLNANVRKSAAPGVYMFYHREGKPVENNEGTAEKTTEDTKYLMKLTLAVEKTEAAARASLTRKGFEIVDGNLSPVSGYYTYLGYKTTTDPTKAITDIRMSVQNSSSPFIFGDSSYTYCASTVTGDGLYYTSYAGAGSPILADVQIVHSPKDAPKGFEPVNLFCGGPAYNFNVGDDVEKNKATSYDHFYSPRKYLYFHPSVTYTEGTEYISGFVLVAGSKADDTKNITTDYVKTLELKKFDGNLTKDLKITKSFSFSEGKYYIWDLDNLETYICYTTTYNPHRAITDAETYIASPSNKSLQASLGSMEAGGFAACEIMYQLPTEPHAHNDLDDFYRGFYQTHSYVNPGTGADIVIEYDDGKMAPDDFEKVEWKDSNVRAKGLYVCGPMNGKTPLTPDDVIVTSSPETPDGFVSIQDARNRNSTQPHNIAVVRSDSKDSSRMYMYVRKHVEKKKYISGLAVVTYDLKNMMPAEDYSKLEKDQIKEIDKTADDTCITSLLSMCTDEVISDNVALKRGDTYRADSKTHTATCSYVGVSRTDDASKAIHGLLKYRSSEKTAPAQITVDSVKYTRCGDRINDAAGSYWIYSALSDGAVPGEPITDVSFSYVPIEKGCATVLTTKTVDTAEKTAVPYGDTSGTYYIHTAFENMGTYVSGIYLGHGKTKNEALCDLLTQRCCIALDMNLNNAAGGEYIYMGYTRYSPKKTDKNAKYAVRDVIFTVGKDRQDELVFNGITYKPVYDSTEKGLSVNSGTIGDKIYLYSTTYYDSGSAKELLSYSPIIKIGLSERDRVPDNNGELVWENVFTTDCTRCNLNSGALTQTEDTYGIVDNRVFMYVNRFDNSVIPVRKITGGHCAEAVDYGKVFFTKG